MSLVAVQEFVQGVVTGVTVAAYPSPLVSYIAPPIPGDAGVPGAYIWGGTMTEKRQTAPRGQGFKELLWMVDIWLLVIQSNDRVDSDTAFPSLADAVMAALRATSMPVMITDPVSGVQSQVISVGEQFDLDYSPVHTVADQVDVQYVALLRCSVKEVLQG